MTKRRSTFRSPDSPDSDNYLLLRVYHVVLWVWIGVAGLWSAFLAYKLITWAVS